MSLLEPSRGTDTLRESDAEFHTTPWTWIETLRSDQADLEMLDRLCRRYWPPVFAFLRRTGERHDAARELTQSFFADVVLGRRLFHRADQSRARLRTLVLAAVKNYRVDVWRQQARMGKTFKLAPELVEEQESQLETLVGSTPDDAFNQRWAAEVLEEGLARCERHYLATDRANHWAAYTARVINPALHGASRRPPADLAAELGFANAAAVASAVHTVKVRLMALLREVVNESVGRDEVEAEDEFVFIVQLLRR